MRHRQLTPAGIGLILLALLIVGCGGGRKVKVPYGRIVEDQRYNETILLDDERMNLIYELRRGDFEPDPGIETLVVSDDGYRVLNERDEMIRRVPFQFSEKWPSRALWGGRSMDMDGDGTMEYVGILVDDDRAAVFDQKGKMVRHTTGPTYADLLILDIDGDQRDEFLLNHWDRLVLYDPAQSRSRKLYDGEALNVQFIGNDDQGRPLIAFDTPGDVWELVILDAEGQEAHRWYVPWLSFTFSPLPDRDGRASRLLFVNGDTINITDLEGKVLRKLEAPYARVLAHMEAADVRGPSGEGYLLVAGRGAGENQLHMVYLFDPDGRLIYQWRGMDTGGPLLVIDEGFGRMPTFLVGGRNELRKFTPHHAY